MLIFAHRGASKAAPENTLQAMQYALQMGAHGIEIDVIQAAGQCWVIHDAWVQRTTNGQGRLDQMTEAQIRQLDAGNGQQVPTLFDVMALVGNRCLLNIELKGITDLAHFLKHLDSACETLNIGYQQLLLSSFDHPLLAKLAHLRPELTIGALTASCPLHYAAFAQELSAASVHTDIAFTNLEFVQDAKARGLKVYVYTVDEVQDMQRLKSWGVDGIFTNVPDRALAWLQQAD
ncbi:glycerophosphodiester phosphodiesterase [Bowmanella sp. Y26]|uniref:glycerophosphodiester phosphodiesterase n=1 Tax=Bowmanella yangjiangensis TaxID=2811230 RepID=UPI001BDD98BE|nr:glycerophosphodiester phosphodiesterase family protein [Bowmanella yangjiangensis]MBT1064227.1 glycerophosphodiester phosphodiesterase [Bowmanella yangjiangensis]